MQVGLHSEPQNIWLHTGTRQPDISSSHHQPCSVSPAGQPASGGPTHAHCMCSNLSVVRHNLYMKLHSGLVYRKTGNMRERECFFHLSHRPEKGKLIGLMGNFHKEMEKEIVDGVLWRVCFMPFNVPTHPRLSRWWRDNTRVLNHFACYRHGSPNHGVLFLKPNL